MSVPVYLVPLLASFLLLAGCLTLDGSGSGGGYPVWRSAPGYGWNSGGFGSSGRYARSSDGVSCDRKTQLCYKRGHIDTSETRQAFGRDAARDADALRDQLGTSHVYILRNRNDSYCLSAEKTCFKNGRPDWSDTRDVYGKKAARRLKDSD